MKMFNCNIVGHITEDPNAGIATWIKLMRAPNKEHAEAYMRSAFTEKYPEYPIFIILIDEITIDEYNINENQVYLYHG